MSALIAMAFLSIPLALFPISPNAKSLSVLQIGFMTIGLAFNVTVPALTTIVVPNDLRGSCLALMSAVSMLCAFGLAPISVSLLSAVIGGPAKVGTALALICVLSSVAAAMTFSFGRRHFPTSVKS
jgi:hypothetical protein